MHHTIQLFDALYQRYIDLDEEYFEEIREHLLLSFQTLSSNVLKFRLVKNYVDSSPTDGSYDNQDGIELDDQTISHRGTEAMEQDLQETASLETFKLKEEYLKEELFSESVFGESITCHEMSPSISGIEKQLR
ncbi:unnamed protein product, partial [Didymodactylos carnosus]